MRSMSSCAASCCICSPQGFVRIRNFGFLANRRRATLLPLCFHLLGAAQTASPTKTPPPPMTPPIFGAAPSVVAPMKVIERLTAAEMRLRSPPAGHRCRMKPLSPTRILHVLRHVQPFCAWPQKKSLLPTSSTHSVSHPFLRFCQLSDVGVVFLAWPHSSAATRHPLSLHSISIGPASAATRAAWFKRLYRTRARAPCPTSQSVQTRFR